MNNMKLNLKYASEVLEGIENIPKGSIVLVKLQTMTGKTTAILGNEEHNIKGLIDKIGDKTLIYLCNREALKRQVKLELCNKYNIDIKKDDNDNTDYNWLDKLEQIGNVTIMSYQSMENKISDREYKGIEFTLENYDYIVCDEFHYILKDAGFNDNTELTFLELNRCWYSNSVVIYMTATDLEVKRTVEKSVDDLIELSKKFQEPLVKEDIFYYYDGGIDYSYLDVKYYKNNKDIITTIKNSLEEEEKWMWFVNSSKDGKDIETELRELGITAEFISKKDNEKIKKHIVENSRFDCKVLITTSVLDNGVNINDKNLVHMIIESVDPITFIQELGRKRMSLDNVYKINLYIPVRYSNFFTLMRNNEEKKLEPINIFNTDMVEFRKRYDRKLYQTKGIVRRTDGEYDINKTYWGRIQSDYKRYDVYIDEIKKDPWYFTKEQLSWLGLKDTFSEDNLIEYVVDNKEVGSLEDFLNDNYENDSLFTKEGFRETMNNLIEKDSRIKDIMNELDGRNTRDKGQKLYNKLFEKLGLNYRVVSKPKEEKINGKRKKITYWIIGIEENK